MILFLNWDFKVKQDIVTYALGKILTNLGLSISFIALNQTK
jgi:hypothetical protein